MFSDFKALAERIIALFRIRFLMRCLPVLPIDLYWRV
jgi:hypothetical protein